MAMQQEPNLAVPSIYIRPIFQAYVREYPYKIWSYMVQYLHFRILKFPLVNITISYSELANNDGHEDTRTQVAFALHVG
jgi:hypothetical protein